MSARRRNTAICNQNGCPHTLIHRCIQKTHPRIQKRCCPKASTKKKHCTEALVKYLFSVFCVTEFLHSRDSSVWFLLWACLEPNKCETHVRYFWSGRYTLFYAREHAYVWAFCPPLHSTPALRLNFSFPKVQFVHNLTLNDVSFVRQVCVCQRQRALV